MTIVSSSRGASLRLHSFEVGSTSNCLARELMSAKSPESPGSVSKNPKLRLPASCDPPDEDGPLKKKVWIIFGATGHMGRSLVRAALAHGDQVVAVGRTFEHTQEQMTGWHANCLGLLCDVRVRETVDAVIKAAIAHYGAVDIIANCTGYGVIAAAEDQSDHDLANQFETNFMGTLHIIQLSLPYFRTNGIPGRYIIFSSTAGALGVPGLGPYCATKYAVEGLVESMLYETHGFNTKATLVEPGHVRLDDDDSHPIGPKPVPSSGKKRKSGDAAGPAHTRLKRYGHLFVKPKPSPPYASETSPAGHARRMVQWLDDSQPTSAVKSAELVWQLGHCSFPPLRLLLGSFAVESIRDRLRSIIEEIEDWKHLNFPADGAFAKKEEEDGADEGERDGDVNVEGEGEGEGEVEGEGDGEGGEQHPEDEYEEQDEHG